MQCLVPCRQILGIEGKMARLEELKPGSSVIGVLPDCLVTVVNTQWFGSEALELTYKDPSGKMANELLYRHDETRRPTLL
jgi:hypothetical protein